VSSGDVDAIVVGAGIAGLAAATELRSAGRGVLVVEAGGRAGGVARSERAQGYLFARAHGLESVLVPAHPSSRARFLLREGRLVALPLGPLELLTSELLSGRGLLRLLAEPFVRRGDSSGESAAEFATRRLGEEASRELVGPFLTGIYAGDESQLGAEAVFPRLVEAERRRGSIGVGLLAELVAGGRTRGLAGTWSALGGLSGFVEALARPLEGALRLATRACEITFANGLYQVGIQSESSSDRVLAPALVLTVPALEAAELLGALDSEIAAPLREVGYAPLVSASFGVDPTRVRERIHGFGYLVPRGEGEVVLGCLFPSQLFAGRAPHGRELFTVLAGGLRSPELVEWEEDRIEAAILAELDRALGLRESPRRLGLTRWPRAVPQPGRDHLRRVAEVRRRSGRYAGLALAGAYLDGVAFGDALASGAAAARRILGHG
jgi:oxygen-dependent protoporphyrinogen oxidase